MSLRFPCILFSITIFISIGCAFRTVKRSKNITYLAADSTTNKPAQKLNVFAPGKRSSLNDVFIFIYGGSWRSGKKSLYNFLGSRMARKDIVTVIMDYPKSPQAQYDEMATDAALAVKWVKKNIERYGGNPDRLFISGHSAGGHLAALIITDDKYFNKTGIDNPLKGAVLIDAAGLDMYNFLKEENFSDGNTYLQTFTNKPAAWKEASPLYHLHKGIPPMLIYKGGKTYPSISVSNERFVTALQEMGYQPEYHILEGKKHIAMITQFLNSGNKRYKEIIQFMHGQQ